MMNGSLFGESNIVSRLEPKNQVIDWDLKKYNGLFCTESL